MSKAAPNPRQQFEQEQATGLVLVARANETNSAIRRRLAAVANDLRLAAQTASSGSENLLELANKFEQHARGGDVQ